ncbi:MAG: hypothetical protein KME05_13055 [Gloeocapsa sp. UFS-A4-WI-NPMV-4B04]|jgi:hypothetical protein|nr:hypothetical protein [Gloeocapsa sp. UFS-A4-WI-NPMV-4B04]
MYCTQAMTMHDKICTQAQIWGFICECDAQGKGQIFPQKTTERWKMQLAEDRWLLIVGDVPQILFQSVGALVFLERRLQGQKH